MPELFLPGPQSKGEKKVQYGGIFLLRTLKRPGSKKNLFAMSYPKFGKGIYVYSFASHWNIQYRTATLIFNGDVNN